MSAFVLTKWGHNASMNDFSPNTGRRSFPMTKHSTWMVCRNGEKGYSFAEYPIGAENLPPFESQVYLFFRQPHDSSHTFTNIFSVSSPNQRSLRSRAFVTHSGQDAGTGVWCCNKDPTSNCSHITIARHFLQKLVRVDPAARDDSISNIPLDNTGNVAHCLLVRCSLHCYSTYLSSGRQT